MMSLTLSILLLLAQPFAAVEQSTVDQSKLAHDFALKDLGGRTIRPIDYRGKVVLINFWATWCVPCQAEMPELIKLQKEYQARGLQIIGITYPPFQRGHVLKVVKQLKVNYPVVFGTEEIASLYGVEDVLPVTLIIDREGRIRDSIKGIFDREEFDEKVKPLLE